MDSHHNLIRVDGNDLYATTGLARWKGHRRIEYNEEAIRAHRENNTGWFVLVSIQTP